MWPGLSANATGSSNSVFVAFFMHGILIKGETRRQMTIAAIFDEGGNSQHEIAFNHAVQGVNRNRCDIPRKYFLMCVCGTQSSREQGSKGMSFQICLSKLFIFSFNNFNT